MVERERIRSIEKVGELLDLFTRAEPTHTLADLSRTLGWNRSSTLRIISTLVDMGFLERSGSGQNVSYQLGVRILQLAAIATSSLDVRRAALPHMLTLADETGDSVYLILHRDYRAFVVERVTGSYVVRSEAVRIGDFLPLNRGAAPTAILAYLPPEEQVKALDVAGATDEERAEWELRSSAIRQVGYSISLGDLFPATGGAGAPIFGADEQVHAAVWLGGVAERFQPERIPLIAQPLLRAASAISARMGYQGAAGAQGSDVRQPEPEPGTAPGRGGADVPPADPRAGQQR